MVDLSQTIKIQWNNANKKYFVGKGYEFTKFYDDLIVKIGDLRTNSTYVVPITCDICGKEILTQYRAYNLLIEKQGYYKCKSCTTKMNNEKVYPKEKYFNRFVDFCNKHGYTLISTIDDYQNVFSKLEYICPLHGTKYVTVSELSFYKVGCNECGNKLIGDRLRRPIEEVIDIIESNGNKLLNPEDFTDTNRSNLRILCGECGNIYVTSLASQISSKRCMLCAQKSNGIAKRLTQDELIQKYNQDEIILLNPEDYINNYTRNLYFKCIECGDYFLNSKANYDFDRNRCSKCTRHMSGSEYRIEQYLIKHNIGYIFQHTFEDCRDKKILPFDFYIPDCSLIIEYDGPHHFYPIYGEEYLETTLLHDKIKNEYCHNNDITIIRIPFTKDKLLDVILDEIFFFMF